MIRAATPADVGAVLAACRAAPAIGAVCEMHWWLWLGNNHMPHQFYLLDGGGVLKHSGRLALLCGPPGDGEELAAFLRFNRIRRFAALGWVPCGWRVTRDNPVLLRTPSPMPLPRLPDGFDTQPDVNAVLDTLESGDGPFHPQARESLWVDLHIRRNHGVAAVYGVWQNGRLASTAGLWAITPAAGYVASVETRPEARGKGYALTLLQKLCADYAALPFSLECGPGLAAYYRRLGFAPTGLRWLTSQNPAESAKEENTLPGGPR